MLSGMCLPYKQQKKICRKQKTVEKQEQAREFAEITTLYDKLSYLLEQKGYARKRRENTSTSFESIKDNNNSARFKCRKETSNLQSTLFMEGRMQQYMVLGTFSSLRCLELIYCSTIEVITSFITIYSRSCRFQFKLEHKECYC